MSHLKLFVNYLGTTKDSKIQNIDSIIKLISLFRLTAEDRFIQKVSKEDENLSAGEWGDTGDFSVK